MPGHGKQMVLHRIVSIYNAITQIRGIRFTNNLGITPWPAGTYAVFSQSTRNVILIPWPIPGFFFSVLHGKY